MSIEATKAQLSAWHIDYCLKLTKLLPVGTSPRWPTAQIFLGHPKQNLGGQYRGRTHTCRYAICYALTAGEAFREVVAHECAHAFQRATYSGRQRWHGEHFNYLMEVCGYPGGNRRCHRHCNIKAQKMWTLLRPYRAQLQNVDITADCVNFREQLNAIKRERLAQRVASMAAAMPKPGEPRACELDHIAEEIYGEI